MRWLRAKEGYLHIDHRASPGTKEIPGGSQFESATATCAHCNTVVILNPNRSRPRGYCRKCDDYICDQCQAGDCYSFNQRLDDKLKQIYRKIQGSIL